MFIGLTKLFIGGVLVGDISSIKRDGDTWIFEMYDTKDIYKSDKITYRDIICGAGDKITLPA